MSTAKTAEPEIVQRSKEVPDMLALGEAELAFAADLLAWLCQRRIIGSITMRNAMLEVRKYNAGDGAGRRAK